MFEAIHLLLSNVRVVLNIITIVSSVDAENQKIIVLKELFLKSDKDRLT
jgi:hypothetical protein